MKKIIYIFSMLFAFTAALPALAVAPKNFQELVDNVLIGSLIKPIVPLLISLAVVVFLYGVITLMFSEGGEKKEEGKQYMLWGIIGIFVMVSVWGLVTILKETFGLENSPIKIEMKLP